ncbi:hypothetical protein OPV22_018125 [Ensete ventricosum]|uniref:Uncharacterized protein n=1 Tax=Ensete ventricosum TaxID=4639 RepID=A0AAX5KF12_ENSVE|nr:hypothetical protein OPV22_035031 [Ensete ventricosum]KAJ8485640.1 hypothetical protein OPV22_018125 [Ensete ventricosum]
MVSPFHNAAPGCWVSTLGVSKSRELLSEAYYRQLICTKKDNSSCYEDESVWCNVTIQEFSTGAAHVNRGVRRG